MNQPHPLYIVASPRPRVGKTLLARLLMEYFLDNGRPLVGFDLNPREPVLAGRFPNLVWPVDIGDIRGQMELFDRLIADTASTKVIDVGYGPFEQFFAVIGDIGFDRGGAAARHRHDRVLCHRSGDRHRPHLCQAARARGERSSSRCTTSPPR